MRTVLFREIGIGLPNPSHRDCLPKETTESEKCVFLYFLIRDTGIKAPKRTIVEQLIDFGE